jgi:geranylgeranyl diphosphate synthase type I
MFLEIKNRVEKELANFIRNLDKSYSLSKISPLLYRTIKDFISREGKRIRPAFFIIGYLGFAKKTPAGLYRTALSLELLHDFMLVHDDIIDKSIMRRGKPSVHAALNQYLSKRRNLKFNGQDLSIVIGDIIYAMAIYAFLSVREDPYRKEMALKKLTEAAFYTGSGEFIELMFGLKNIDEITLNNIYSIYDLKTANYTFATPLSMGATLAGAKKSEADRLFRYGIYLGRAFQIKDDCLGIFGSQDKIGKSSLTDLKEAKKTILIWHAYRHSKRQDKLVIKNILSKKKVGKNDLFRVRKILSSCQALKFASDEINTLIKKAESINRKSTMRPEYRNALNAYARRLLSL